MRQTTVTITLASIAAIFVFFLVNRDRAPLPDLEASPIAVTGEKTATSPATTAAPREAKSAEASSEKPAQPSATAELGRSLRVVTHGWDLVVPGLVAREAGEFKKRGLELEVRSVSRLDDIEAALAAGGSDKKGADIAIVALPLLALAYEDLRALRPELFWVVGYSRGRDALYAKKKDALTARPRGKTTLVADKERAATFMSLFALDLAGADVSKVALISPDDARRDTASFAAIDRSLASASRLEGTRRQLLSSADATALVPYVAIAPRGFLERNPEVATAFGAAWLRGVEKLGRDVPAAARTVAALDGTPAPVVLIKRLGQIEFVDLSGNASLLGLSGRGAVSAHELFRASFRIWRQAGIINTAAPDAAPISPAAVSTLVSGRGARAVSAARASVATGARPLLVTRALSASEDRAVERVGIIAGLFSRSVIEVGFNGRKKSTQQVIERATERFGIDPDRLVPAPKRSKRRHLTVAVMPIP